MKAEFNWYLDEDLYVPMCVWFEEHRTIPATHDSPTEWGYLEPKRALPRRMVSVTGQERVIYPLSSSGLGWLERIFWRMFRDDAETETDCMQACHEAMRDLDRAEAF